MPEQIPTPPPVDYTELAPRPPDGPVRLADYAGDWAEVEIEIGFGRGMFFYQRAQVVPHHLLLGFEVKKKLAYQVAKRCEQLQLVGARAMFGDIRDVLPRIEPAGQVARVFMNFPDPWWKKRHGKRRLVGEPLLEDLARLLRPGGEFFMQTDVEERAHVHAAEVAEHPSFELGPNQGFIENNPYDAVSNREKRAVEDGLPIYRVLVRRVG